MKSTGKSTAVGNDKKNPQNTVICDETHTKRHPADELNDRFGFCAQGNKSWRDGDTESKERERVH